MDSQEIIMTRHLSATEVRDNFSKVVDRVSRKRERVVLSRRGKELAAIVPLEDLENFERVKEDLEDRLDVEAARKALKEPGDNIPLEDYLKKRGL
jgi:prevent-host-death family protein